MHYHVGDDGKLDNSVQEVITYILDKALPPVVHKEIPLPRGVRGIWFCNPAPRLPPEISLQNTTFRRQLLHLSNLKVLKCIFVTRWWDLLLGVRNDEIPSDCTQRTVATFEGHSAFSSSSPVRRSCNSRERAHTSQRTLSLYTKALNSRSYFGSSYFLTTQTINITTLQSSLQWAIS
jgi:hypothetical protein